MFGVINVLCNFIETQGARSEMVSTANPERDVQRPFQETADENKRVSW